MTDDNGDPMLLKLKVGVNACDFIAVGYVLSDSDRIGLTLMTSLN